MIDAQIPVDFLAVFGFFIHPQLRGIQVSWSSKSGVRRNTFSRETIESDSFRATPYRPLLQNKRTLRFRLGDDIPDDSLGLARQFQKAGHTEHVFLPLFNFDGTVNGGFEVATKQQNGFSDDHITALRRLQAPLARMKEYFTERLDKQITLATYVGEEISRKVLKGSIVLGDGETISAVVLFDEASRRDVKTVCSLDFRSIAIGLSASAVEYSFRGFDGPVEMFVVDQGVSGFISVMIPVRLNTDLSQSL